MAVDLSLLPESIAAAAKELEKRIEFEYVNEKAGSGYVLVGRNLLMDRKVVVKFYYWGDGAHAEPKILSELASTHVLKVDDAAAINLDHAYFVAPFCEAGDLDDAIQRGGIGLKRAVDILIDISSGASFIHGKGYIHRDIKPSNIFCEAPDRFVIGDFGSIVKKGEHGSATAKTRHSLFHRTPEEIQLERVYEQSDIYQIGVILYQLIGGSLPYDERAWLKSGELAAWHKLSHPENQIYAREIIEKKITKGTYLDLRSLPPWSPRELVSLIRRCCDISIEGRFESASALMAKLNNLRARLPDWRLEPHPTLYRTHAKFRVVESKGQVWVEKMVNTAGAWRKVRAVQPSSMKEAIQAAEKL
ncbi:serine/threonine protein kinase [Plastoroseomonas hellenica]|uniref:serine/threonine protein kinase n=1 Tax=Plastoroseomonas hellenica TaxID=2687306 RepID=UPI001BA796A5|nr:protein kinase [Plastoroseomonas hellenica]MBR0644838.1 protein kinase [Plastoroseomonas hellenica]